MSEHSGSGERTLYDLTPGESGMILSVGNQSGAVKRRLVDMGLTPGTVVKVTKIAPLGDPLEVSLRGMRCPCAGRTRPRSGWDSPGGRSGAGPPGVP